MRKTGNQSSCSSAWILLIFTCLIDCHEITSRTKTQLLLNFWCQFMNRHRNESWKVFSRTSPKRKTAERVLLERPRSIIHKFCRIKSYGNFSVDKRKHGLKCGHNLVTFEFNKRGSSKLNYFWSDFNGVKSDFWEKFVQDNCCNIFGRVSFKNS